MREREKGETHTSTPRKNKIATFEIKGDKGKKEFREEEEQEEVEEVVVTCDFIPPLSLLR